MISDLLYRLRALFRRNTVEAEMDDELRYHLDRQAEKYHRAGVAPPDAARRAVLAFGGPEQVREACRDARGTRWIEDLWKDARFGLRSLRRSPVLSLVAILSLALGIGANTAIFTVVNAVLLRPLPYRQPSQLVMIWDTFPARGQTHNVTSALDYLHWREQGTGFAQLAGIDWSVDNLTGLGEPEEIHGQYVTPSFFPVLGVAPALGRAFTESEAGVDKKVIVISHRFWARHYLSDRAALGGTVELNRQSFTIIGVMPESFEFLDSEADYWLPFYIDPHKDQHTQGRFLRVVARLKPGVTVQQAQGQLNAIAEQAAKDDPGFHKGWGAQAVTIRDEVSGDYRRPLYVLLGAVCLVLLIACVNVANLLLSRSAARRRELAVRTSLGAGPWRIARQLFVESALLAVFGGALGTLLALWGVKGLKTFAPPSLPQLANVGMDGRVFLFTALLSLAAALIFGMAPAFLGARIGPNDALKDAARSGGSTARTRRIPNLLVMVEFALSLVLLTGSGLLIRSFANLLSTDIGMRTDHLLTARVLLPGSYKGQQRAAFFRDATQKIAVLPGVISASAVSFMPFGGIRPGTGFAIEGRPKPGPGESPITQVRSVRPDYFRTMGIALLRGRDISERDNDPDHPVFVINQALAARYWPHEDPIGQRITVQMTAHPMPGEIVGIAADATDEALDGEATPSVFYAHPGLPISYMSFVVRTAGDPASLGGAVQQVVHSIDPNQPVVDLRTLDQVLVRSVSSRRFQMSLLILFAAIALALAAAGIYGVISYSVLQRTNEIGIRMAMGAGPGDVLRLVMVQGATILLGGLALGFGGALLLTRTISTFLFKVSPADPLTFGLVAVVLAAVAVAAAIGPARRATRVDPLVALRYE